MTSNELATLVARLHSSVAQIDRDCPAVFAADVADAIESLVRERDAFETENDLLTHKIITCGVAASHPDANLAHTGVYADKWNSPQAESVRKLRAERDELRVERHEYEAMQRDKEEALIDMLGKERDAFKVNAERLRRALRELVTARDGLKQGRQESADHYLAAWRQARAALKDAP